MLDEVMLQAAAEMTASLAKTRAAMSHSLSKGEALEETVRRFLRRHLPSSLGIAKGQIADAKGGRSAQLDVIIYDSDKTPLLFTSEEDSQQVVPSEGVVAVIEVKTRVTASDVAGIVDHMLTVKNLDKTAYFETGGVIRSYVQLYGQELEHSPTLYFLFAFESGGLESVTEALIRAQLQLPIAKRVDCACLLDKGMVLNNTPPGVLVDAVPTEDSQIAAYPTPNALFLFYILVTRYLFQRTIGNIDLKQYIPPGFNF